MKVTAEHPEAEGQRSGMGMEERFLLNGIALHARDVSPRHAQTAAVIETNLAHAHRAVGDGAAVAARVAAKPRPAGGPAVDFFDELRRGVVRSCSEKVLQGCH